MFSPPPIPPWNGVHPVLVHLPIGVLIFAPVLLLIAAVDAKRRRTWACAGLVAMVVGSAAAWVAVLSGEAAADIVPETARTAAAIHEHEELAETARTIFIALTVLLAALLAVGSWVKAKWARPVVVLGSVGLGIGYAGGLLVLANAGHEGGRLVHELGIHAPLSTYASTHAEEDPDD